MGGGQQATQQGIPGMMYNAGYQPNGGPNPWGGMQTPGAYLQAQAGSMRPAMPIGGQQPPIPQAMPTPTPPSLPMQAPPQAINMYGNTPTMPTQAMPNISMYGRQSPQGIAPQMPTAPTQIAPTALSRFPTR